MATYIQRGETIDFVNGTDTAIEAGAVVSLATRIGIAAAPIAAGKTGAVHVTGVFEIEKKASEALTVGAAVYYSADGITATSTDNVPAGWVIAAAAADDATVRVKIG